jgi:tRNA(Ile)-lysidine synthetase-like protein
MTAIRITRYIVTVDAPDAAKHRTEVATTLARAVDALPAGRYGVGVSGGADSTALALLLSRRTDCHVVLIHLNHELRGNESDDDEGFICDLAAELGRTIVVARRSALASWENTSTANPSARYRQLRLALFREVAEVHDLDAIALAHHADDQAETVLLRLARGSGPIGLAGMGERATVSGVPIVRPLLRVRSDDIRLYLRSIDQSWREDSSNRTAAYRRNVLRAHLQTDPALTPILCELADQCRALREALDRAAPHLPERFPCALLKDLPPLIAEHAARRWLAERGCDPNLLSNDTCARLVRQATDPTAPLRQHFPGKRLVRRRKGHLFI